MVMLLLLPDVARSLFIVVDIPEWSFFRFREVLGGIACEGKCC